MSEECRKHRIQVPIVAPSACASCKLEKFRGDRHDFAVENERLRAELAALKVGQGEAVAWVIEDNDGTQPRIARLKHPLPPVGTKLYTAPPATGVIVPRELLEEAECCAFVLENIGSLEPSDIDGDDIDLRFEDAEGRDTGSDISIVEYAERAAKTIRALLAQSQGGERCVTKTPGAGH